MTSRSAAWMVALVSAVIIFLLAEDQLPTESLSARAVLSRLQVLPVMVAGLLLGWRCGLGIGLLAGAGVVWVAAEGEWGALDLWRWVDLAMLAAIGTVAGLVSQGHHRRMAEHQRMAEQLQQAHAEMQENFEGMKRAERLFAVGNSPQVWHTRSGIPWPVFRVRPGFCGGMRPPPRSMRNCWKSLTKNASD